MVWSGTEAILKEIESTMYVMHLNHLQTILPLPGLWTICLPCCISLLLYKQISHGNLMKGSSNKKKQRWKYMYNISKSRSGTSIKLFFFFFFCFLGYFYSFCKIPYLIWIASSFLAKIFPQNITPTDQI